MEWLTGIGVVVGMLILRLAVPVALMVALVTLVRRLDTRMRRTTDCSSALGGGE